jgi:PAS domain S-box-containing protein
MPLTLPAAGSPETAATDQPGGPPGVRRLRYAGLVLALALVYYGAARLGLRYASIGPTISLVWPPTGIAFAALVLLGRRLWPGVALGAFLANAATPIPLAAAVGIAGGNTLEAVLAASLLVRVAGHRPNLELATALRALILVAAPVGALASAAVGVTTLMLTGELSARLLPTALPVWWAGDFLGALVVAPLILSWSTTHRSTRSARGIVEVVVLCLGTALAAEIGLGSLFRLPLLGELEYPSLLFPFVIWSALRFGARGVTLSTFLLAVVAVWHTARGGGPFVAPTPMGTLFAITAYLGVVAVTGLALAAAVTFERDRASRALIRSQEQLRLSLEAARMGTWSWSVATNALAWDANLKQLYGLSPDHPVTSYEDFIGRVHPEDRAFVETAVRDAMERGGELDYEFRIILPDGRIRWIADQGHVLRDESGRPEAMTGVCMDVTERRMTEERIRQAHRMESVGRLAGGVAHETNNQMSVVLGASSFVLNHPGLPTAVRADVELIQRAAQRTASVTAQLLAFSRQQVMKREVVDLNPLLQSWEPLLRRALGEDCTLTLGLHPGVGFIRADPGQLQQVVLNLALNARDAMPRGGTLGIEVFGIRLTREYGSRRPRVTIEPGDYVCLAVSDTGRGIDPEVMEHIFEPFFTTKGIGQGTGLGLSTVYGIVKQSDGYIWAYSEPGHGATFKLYFPVTPGTPEAVSRPAVAAGPGNGERILVVEDEAAVRDVLTRVLHDAGYQVTRAAGGPEALEMMAREDGDSVDLLITDVVMSGMSGRELATRVAARVPGLPVIYVSGYTDGEITRRGLLEPGAAFIQKPFSPEVILAAVSAKLNGRSTDPAR